MLMTVATFPLKVARWSDCPLCILILSGFSSFLRISVCSVMSSFFPHQLREQAPGYLHIPAFKRNQSVCIKVAKDKTEMQ